jgi:hypothetical protein
MESDRGSIERTLNTSDKLLAVSEDMYVLIAEDEPLLAQRWRAAAEEYRIAARELFDTMSEGG